MSSNLPTIDDVIGPLSEALGGAPDAARSAAAAAVVQEASAARDLAAVTVAVRGLATLAA